tara:strand:+ start:161 stop:634 length:474 start_codon:yes stop_codon:yes gene_type:complete
MFRKIIFCILVLCSLSGCGYTSLHSQKDDSSFSVLNLELDGNFIINSYIEQKFKKYEKIDSERRFELEIKTTLNKLSVGKDSKGNTTNLKLVANLDVDINEIKTESEPIKKAISFTESITIKKSEINYEQSIYEEILIKNMSELLFKKLTFYLSRSQ